MTDNPLLLPEIALSFYHKYGELSEKTRFFRTAATGAMFSGTQRKIIECGAQRSVAKQTLISDGWSTTTFMCLPDNPLLVSIDPLYADSSVQPILRRFVPVAGRMEQHLPAFLSEVRQWSVVLLDGPDDPYVTNDCLCYLADIEYPLMVIMDDVAKKVSPEALNAMKGKAGSTLNFYKWSATYQTGFSNEKYTLQFDLALWLLNYPTVKSALLHTSLSDFHGKSRPIHHFPLTAHLI